MGNFIFSVNAVLPLFILTALGWLLTRLKIWNDSFLKSANSLSFQFFIPVMLFYNICTSDFHAVFNTRLMLFVLCTVLIISSLGMALVPIIVKKNARRGVIVQALFRGNYLLLGLPLCQSMFGDAGAQAASVFAAFIIPVFNVLATIVLSIYNGESVDPPLTIIKNIIKNPLIIASMLGILFAAFQIPLPAIVKKPLLDIKSIATPFALLVLGGDFKFRSFFENISAVVSTGLLRLIAVPTAVLTSAYFLGFRGIDIAVLISIFTTPVAVSSCPMTYKMNGDYELACQVVVFTTLFSTFSIVLFIYLSKALGLI